MLRYSHRSWTSVVLSALALTGSVALDAACAQTTAPSVTQPQQDPGKKTATGAKANTGAPSSTGVGASPVEGAGETGNGRVLNGNGGSGVSAPLGTRDPDSTTGTAGGAAGAVSPD